MRSLADATSPRSTPCWPTTWSSCRRSCARRSQARRLTKAYLGAALEALLNETFRYVGEWIGPDSAVLEFVATIDGVEVNGADFIAWNGADQIVSFKVMIRPLKAIELVRQRMAARLAAGAILVSAETALDALFDAAQCRRRSARDRRPIRRRRARAGISDYDSQRK